MLPIMSGPGCRGCFHVSQCRSGSGLGHVEVPLCGAPVSLLGIPLNATEEGRSHRSRAGPRPPRQGSCGAKFGIEHVASRWSVIAARELSEAGAPDPARRLHRPLPPRRIRISFRPNSWTRGHALDRHSVFGSSTETDLRLLTRTIELADEAVLGGNHPFGAILVDASGEVIAEGKNSHSVDRGPGHAEANLARDAARRFELPTLRGSTLYTSVEPCSMCAGTIYWAEIGAVVFGMSERRLGEMTGEDPENPTQDLECRQIFASGRREVLVRGPFPDLEDRIAAQHRAFWRGGAG